MSPTTFDIRDPLPRGVTTVLEASAGTGKTWTIGALVTRYVAEGSAALEDLLVITFGRAASQEMRDRVREQLVSAEHRLADPAGARHGDDPLLAVLADADDAEVAKRRARLRRALTDFDAATIATTHQFAQAVLQILGTAGDSDGSARLVEDVADLVEQIVDDLYLSGVSDSTVPLISRREALDLAQTAVNDPQARLVPTDLDRSTRQGQRVWFATEVRRRLAERMRHLRLVGFDDLISDLAAALRAPNSPARDLMRRRWPVVLVDEFQDTDPLQWEVLKGAFHGHGTLILIGDPKQAIYAFRGGDVVAYLDAVGAADQHFTLGTNWRSDQPLVQALDATFAGATLGDARITVPPVAAGREGQRLAGAPHAAPFRLRVLTREDADVPEGALVRAPVSRQLVARDLAADIAGLLGSGATFDHGGGQVPLHAGDVAVLVATGSQADQVQAALRDHGIASVLGGGTNVLLSAAADDWVTLLEGMLAPQRSGLVRAVALTDFFGRTAEELARDADQVTDEVAGRLLDLGELMRDRGIAAVFEAVTDNGRVVERVLSRPDGLRRMTDLRHVSQLLHEVALADRLGLVALTHWLHQQRAEGAGFGNSNERTRRLDSDTAAVQVLTIHRSKGLQFPVVYLPFMHDRWIPDDSTPRFHDADGRRLRDVSGTPSGEHRRRALAEDAGEALRLTYVAMTRAQSQLVAWWAPTTNARNAGLHRLLFRPDPEAAEVPLTVAPPADAQALRVLSQWQARGGPSIERFDIAEPAPVPMRSAPPLLEVRRFDRELDLTWRRTSYTGLTRTDDQAPTVTSEPEDEGTTDEMHLSGPVEASQAPVSPMAGLPTGAGFGSVVHGVLETADFSASDLPAELLARAAEQSAWWGVRVDTEQVAASLLAVVHTPLGPLADQLTLASLLTGRQLRELPFELPLAGGDTAKPGDPVPHLGDVADLVDAHLPSDDPMRRFATRLRSPGLGSQPLRGYLTGSIDVTVRLPDGRCLIVDYKTNSLGGSDAPLTLAGYRPAALTEAMLGGTYPLQALLYAVVLHRFLRWRQRDYDPQVHLGGVLYLYVRGMAGPHTPTDDGHPYGVFSWRPPVGLIESISDLIDGSLA